MLPYSSATWKPGLKVSDSKKPLSETSVKNLVEAEDKIQATFKECPELKELYHDQYVQLLDTLIQNKVEKSA